MSQHDGQQHYDDGLEVVPSSFPEVVQPPIFAVTEGDALPGASQPPLQDSKPAALIGKDAEGLIAQETEIPPPPPNGEESDSAKAGWATRKRLVLAALALLLLALAIGLGVGLGLGLRGAANTANQAGEVLTATRGLIKCEQSADLTLAAS